MHAALSNTKGNSISLALAVLSCQQANMTLPGKQYLV